MKPRILSRYLFKEIVHYFLLYVLVFVVIMTVSEIYDTRNQVMEKQPSVSTVLMYLALSLPEKISSFLPLVGLLGVMMAYGLLAKNREILAMIAAGISFKRLAIPALTFGVLLSVFAFWFNEAIVPKAHTQALYLEKVSIGGRDEDFFSKAGDIFIKGIGNKFYYVQEYHPNTRTMIYPTMIQLSEETNEVEERVEGRVARPVSEKEGEQVWELEEALRWRFNPDGSLASYEKFDGPHRIDVGENLAPFLGKPKDPLEMNFFELREYVGLMKERGETHLNQFSTPMFKRLAFPIVCLVMAMLGFAAVLDLHARRFAHGAFIGLVAAIGYYLLEGVFITLGQGGHLPSFFAAWTALLIFMVIVWFMVRRLEQLGH